MLEGFITLQVWDSSVDSSLSDDKLYLVIVADNSDMCFSQSKAWSEYRAASFKNFRSLF